MIIPEVYEAFVYIWYNALSKMYYIGSHKGKPTDKYTHSSTVWESFTKETIPEGVSRRILAYGTHDDMKELEIKLLTNRRFRKNCWDRYYNVKWNTKAIGSLLNILSEDEIKSWKQKISKKQKGIPKPAVSISIRKYHASLTEEQRKEIYGHANEEAWNWKGGISLGDNRKNYMNNDYDDRKKLCKELVKQGLSYYEIKEKHKRALICYPYELLPQEIKDMKRANAVDRYEHKRECYCRKDTCDYCFPLKQTPEERKRREAKTSKIRNERDKLDPIKDAHNKEVSRAWEEKNKEKRKQQQRDRYVKKGPADTSGEKNPFYGRKHTEETKKKISESKKLKKQQGQGTLEQFL